MKSIAIHIGFHKSASTYLQKFVFPNIDATYFFLSGPSGNTRQYLDYIQKDAQNYVPNKFKELVKDGIKKTDRKATNDLVIMSHEELSGHPHGYRSINPYNVAENLSKTYPQAKIIIVLRNQFDYLTSLYTYRVAIKGDEYRSFDCFLEQEGALGLFEKLEYDKIVKCYIDFFGKGQVLVLPMELLKNNAERFHRTLTDFVGAAPIEQHRSGISNKSTRIIMLLSLWRIVNRAFNKSLSLLHRKQIMGREEFEHQRIRYIYYYFKRTMTSWLTPLFKSGQKIDIKNCNNYTTYSSRYVKSNNRLQTMVEFDLKLLGYPL